MKNLSRADRELLDEVQFRFPLVARPYERIARKLGRSEEWVMRRLRGLRRRGVVRRIGPSFRARALGLRATLIAISVPPSKVREAAGFINRHYGVTHNYLRGHRLNIWFTLATANSGSERAFLRRLKTIIRPRILLNLPARKTFKLGVLPAFPHLPARVLSPRAIPSTRVYKKDFANVPMDIPVSPFPYPPGAIRAVRRLLSSGAAGRFGAVLDISRLGFRYNALVAWSIPRSRQEDAGARLASLPWVSHCYLRRKFGNWPYSLYTMIHAENRMEGMRFIGGMEAVARPTGLAVMETIRLLGRKPLDPRALFGCGMIPGALTRLRAFPIFQRPFSGTDCISMRYTSGQVK